MQLGSDAPTRPRSTSCRLHADMPPPAPSPTQPTALVGHTGRQHCPRHRHRRPLPPTIVTTRHPSPPRRQRADGLLRRLQLLLQGGDLRAEALVLRPECVCVDAHRRPQGPLHVVHRAGRPLRLLVQANQHCSEGEGKGGNEGEHPLGSGRARGRGIGGCNAPFVKESMTPAFSRYLRNSSFLASGFCSTRRKVSRGESPHRPASWPSASNGRAGRRGVHAPCTTPWPTWWRGGGVRGAARPAIARCARRCEENACVHFAAPE